MFTSGGGSDADDLQSRLAASNGALQSLLRRLSTGMEDLLPNAHGRARMKVSHSLSCPFVGGLSWCRVGLCYAPLPSGLPRVDCLAIWVASRGLPCAL